MDFNLSEDQIMLRDSTKDFVVNSLSAHAGDADKNRQFETSALTALKELGYFGICLPPELGGAGFDTLSLVIVLEELAKYNAAEALLVSNTNALALGGLNKFTSQEIVKDYITKIASGDKIGSIALNESDDNFNLDSVTTRAAVNGELYLMNGIKKHVLFTQLADFYLISAQIDGGENESLFLVEKDAKGLKITKKPRMMGVNAASPGDIELKNCEVKHECIVGQQGYGREIAEQVLLLNQLGLAAIAVGISAGSLEEAIEYSQVRKQFNRPISDFHAIKFMLADMSSNIEAARLLVYKAASLSPHDSKYATAIASAKLFASETAFRNVHHANQIFGGYGYIKEYTIERLFREQLLTELFEMNGDSIRLRITESLLG